MTGGVLAQVDSPFADASKGDVCLWENYCSIRAECQVLIEKANRYRLFDPKMERLFVSTTSEKTVKNPPSILTTVCHQARDAFDKAMDEIVAALLFVPDLRVDASF